MLGVVARQDLVPDAALRSAAPNSAVLGAAKYVQIPSEELLDEREVYECECGKAFGIDGVMGGSCRAPTDRTIAS